MWLGDGLTATEMKNSKQHLAQNYAKPNKYLRPLAIAWLVKLEVSKKCRLSKHR